MRNPNSVILVVAWVFLGGLSLVTAACGSEDDACGPGNDLVPALVAEGELDTFRVASIGVDEFKVSGTEAEHNTLVQANFSDFTDYMVTLAPRLDFLPNYPACYVITGQPTVSGAPVNLGIESVTFSGLIEPVVLSQVESGQIPPDLLPQRGFAGTEVGVDVASAGGADDFPAFSETLPAPLMPAPGRVGDTDWGDLMAVQDPSIGITVDRAYPLVVEWEPADGDVIEVKIIPNAGSSTDYMKLRCITFDDGCLEIPAGAIGHLALDDATNFKLRIERHNYVVHPIRDGDTVEAAAIIGLSASMETIVTR
ncbi:MAG: hypothetical protein JRF33_21960 [Deltaproteobacteria bacterium]|nr:hypothetical protein [Deltaproteobacteria bacterium]